jgi:hypothetical protein
MTYDLAHLTHEFTSRVEPSSDGICEVYFTGPTGAEIGWLVTDDNAGEFLQAFVKRMEPIGRDGNITWMDAKLSGMLDETSSAIGRLLDQFREKEYRRVMTDVLSDTDEIRMFTGSH